MKNIKFIALITLMLGGMTMKAQEYHPIVEDGKQWNVLFSYPWSPPESPHRYTDIYKIEGDTLLDGVSYKVMYTTRNEDLTGWSVCGVIRENENKQVFYRRDGSPDEQMLYDFSMQVGDTIYMYGEYMVVIETGETIVNGEPRQQVVLEYPWGGGESEIWIEGIGSLYGIIDSGSLFLVGGSTDLLCYYEDGDLIWQNSNPNWNSCYIVYSGGGQSGLVVTPTLLIFDEPATPQTFTISNQYDFDITVTNIFVQPDDNIVLVSYTDLPQTLQPDESMDVQVELNAIGNKGYNTYHIYVLTSEGTKTVVVRVNENAWDEYYPLVQEGGRQDWNVLYIITGSAYPDVYHTDIQFIEGDSVIDGVAYRQAWVKGPNDNEPRLDGFVREEDKRVYYRRQSNYGLEAEVLLYDFNLTVGDTVTVNWGNTTLLVMEESEVEVDGVMRRQLGLGDPENGVSPFSEVDEYWIEGVGSTHGFLNSGCEPWSWFGSFVHLLCYYENDNLIWDNEVFDECVMNSDDNCWDGTIAEVYAGGDGTEENPYQIATPQQLALLAYQTNSNTGGDAHYILTDDICLNVANDSIDWLVIGKETSQNLPIYFRGVFDGNGHTIEKMIIRESHIDAGLFGHTRGAVIKNLRVVDATIQVGSDVGIIVGQAYNTSIINCIVQSSTIINEHTSYNYVGGLVGGYYPTDNASDTVYIKDCVSEVRFMNPERFFIAGGIVGRCMTMSTDGGFAVIENCENRNDVGGYDYVGGIMGSADNSHNGESLALIIKGCRNYGNISSTISCGGIVGYNWGVQMIGCLNMGEVVAGGGNSNVAVGGMAALLKESIMVECVNKGSVRSESNSGSEIGGLVGFNDESVIANSYNIGAVSAPYNVPANAIEAIGGIVGNSTGRIFNVYNAGVLTVPETPSGSETEGYGNILGLGDVAEHYLNCYWLEQGDLTACSNLDLPGSSSFIPTMYFSYWILNEPQYGYMDFLTALNFGAEVVLDSVPEYPYLTTWVADTENINQGLPILASIPELNDTIQSGDLLYSIISVNPPCVSVIGHVDGENAQGELVIPEVVTYMGFDYTVTEVGDHAFQRCSGLTGTLAFPTTIRIIGVSAFAQCTGFTELVLPEGLLEIREMAFRDCTGFTGALDFPETVTHIKYGSFNRCTGFSGDLILPNSVREVGNTQNYSYFYGQGFISTFADCFDHLVLSQSLDTIGYGCFSNCERLTGHLVMPEGLKAIHNEAFYFCFGLTGLTLNDSLVHIGRMAFDGCGITGTLVIPENVELASFAFSQCNGIEALVLPHHLSFAESGELGYVFGYCRGLVTLDIPEGWTETGDYTFTGCYNLQQVHLPESLTTINTNTFSYCTHLEEINIPEGVTEIGDAAFMSCDSLTSVELPAGLQRLGGGAFSHCFNLVGDFIVPDLVERIESNTFHSCANLNRIVLGNSVNYVVDDAFANTQMEALVLKSMTPPELERNPYNPVWNIPAYQLIIVPCGALEAYQNSESWAGFTNITEDCGNGLIEFHGSEWYYEIQDEYGNITYQHLEYTADTTINHKDVQIIIRTNTLYDKGEHQVVTREYLYVEDNLVHWWNNDLQEFTVLYDLGAQIGDSWVIKVGTETLTMHVDAVDQYYYEGQTFRMLRVSDEGDLFSGTIVCGIGHLSSFFPERLMTRSKDYRVYGLRCYWSYGNLVFTINRDDCDAIYAELHNGLDETNDNGFAVYPNPTNGILFVETCHGASLPDQTYRITNLVGQTLLTGRITTENQQIDVSKLPNGMFFVIIGGMTQKFIVQ